MQSELIEILFYFYIGKINDLMISSVYFFGIKTCMNVY